MEELKLEIYNNEISSDTWLYNQIIKDGKIEEDVEHKIRVGWLKWRLLEFLVIVTLPSRLKENF